jgi:hypothetical protein
MQTVLNITRNGRSYFVMKGRLGYWITYYTQGSNSIPELINPAPIATTTQAWQELSKHIHINKPIKTQVL